MGGEVVVGNVQLQKRTICQQGRLKENIYWCINRYYCWG